MRQHNPRDPAFVFRLVAHVVGWVAAALIGAYVAYFTYHVFAYLSGVVFS
jgi:hypothetical protein